FVSLPKAVTRRLRPGFDAVPRFVFFVVRRRFFMASLSGGCVPMAAMLPPRHRDYREIPAASCPPLGSGAGIVSAQTGALEGARTGFVRLLSKARSMSSWVNFAVLGAPAGCRLYRQ